MAKLWVDHGLSPRDVLGSPQPVVSRAMHILRHRQAKEADSAAWSRLHEQLKGGG